MLASVGVGESSRQLDPSFANRLPVTKKDFYQFFPCVMFLLVLENRSSNHICNCKTRKISRAAKPELTGHPGPDCIKPEIIFGDLQKRATLRSPNDQNHILNASLGQFVLGRLCTCGMRDTTLDQHAFAASS
jgi:hypothetical protein